MIQKEAIRITVSESKKGEDSSFIFTTDKLLKYKEHTKNKITLKILQIA